MQQGSMASLRATSGAGLLEEFTMDGTEAGTRPANTNPFNIPADEDIFRNREEDRRTKAQLRITALQQSVAAKSTFASRMQATTTEDAKLFLKQYKVTNKPEKQWELTLAATAAPPRRRGDKENMTDFIAKKREIFLLQMSLDTKRAEIKKLEERARQREEALKKSEQMLQEDALRFDEFLKENDEKVQEAIKRAEVEAKAKQDKVLDIKRLTTAIAALRSEMNKYEEQLEDCRKYRDFLDSITPAEFFEAQAAKVQACKEAMLAEWQGACDDVRRRKEAAMAAKAKADHEYANARTQQEAERAEKAIKEALVNLRQAVQEKEPPPPNLDFEVTPEEEVMYFNESGQLLAIYQELEESNLFYIQNAQETEEALEELRNKSRDTRARMDAEVSALSAQVAALQEAIAAAQARGKRLKDKTIEDVGALTLSMGTATANGPAISLDQLTGKVAAVYVRCGFDADQSIGTLQMLTNIESKLEEFLQVVDGLPYEFVEATEKAREKERRRVARDEKLAAATREHEARMARALERASAPVFKKQGKPVMARSAPPKKKVEVKKDDKADEEAELEAYLARDLI